MVKRIKLNLEILESMLFYWKATSEKEKVGESFLYTIVDHENMKHLYNDEFGGEDVRKVLSAISNREMFEWPTKAVGRFWNNNMWMLEDLEYTELMLAPLKTLNLDDQVAMINEKTGGKGPEEGEIVCVPGHLDVYNIVDGTLFVNFFRVKPDLMDESIVTIEDKDLKTWMAEKAIEAIG